MCDCYARGVNSEKLDPRKYTVDYDWLWAKPPHNDGSPATVRARVSAGTEPSPSDPMLCPSRKIRAWWESLTEFSETARGKGGWVAHIDAHEGVVEITSGGEDVADGIQDGTESFFEGVINGTDFVVEYEQLPRK